MKSFCKNLIGILAVGSVLVLGANSALASIVLSLTSPQQASTPITITMTGNSPHAVIYNTNNGGSGVPVVEGLATGTGFVWTPTIAGNYSIVQCNAGSSGGSVCSNPTITYTDMVSNPSYPEVGLQFYTITAPPTPIGLTFFGGQSSGTGSGHMTNTAFVGQVATALGATTAGIYPIVALIAGILVALIITTKIISLYKKTGTAGTKTKEKPLRKTTALYNKDGRYAGVIYD